MKELCFASFPAFPAECKKDPMKQVADLEELDEEEMLMRAIDLSLEEEEEEDKKEEKEGVVAQKGLDPIKIYGSGEHSCKTSFCLREPVF